MIAYNEVFRRHPGVYDVMHTTERAGKKDGSIEQIRVASHLRINKDQVIELVRREIAADASATLTIFCATRGDNGCIGWFNSDNIEHMLREVDDDGGVDHADDEGGEAALLPPRRHKHVQEVGDEPDGDVARQPRAAVADRPVRSVSPRAPRGSALAIGTGDWPKKSEPARVVREWFESTPGRRATSAEIVEALGPTLTGMGVQFPASLISRLKQAGLLQPASEE